MPYFFSESTETIIKIISSTASLLWIPYIYSLCKRTRPSPVYIEFDGSINIGFTNQGPLIYTRIVMCSPDSGDIVFSDYSLKLIHTSGSEYNFYSGDIRNTMNGEYFNPTNNESIAIRSTKRDFLTLLRSGGLVDKEVIFYCNEFKEYTDPLLKKVIERENYETDREKLANDQVISEWANGIKSKFIWSEGDYFIKFNVVVKNKKVVLKGNIKSFTLSAIDINKLEQNKLLIDAHLYNMIRGKPDHKFTFLTKDIITKSKNGLTR